MAKDRPAGPKYLRVFDVDAQAELRRVPLSEVRLAPRIGERIHLSGNREHGGGLYVVVGLTHALADRYVDDPGLEPETTIAQEHLVAHVTGIVVEVKPIHAEEPAPPLAAAEADLPTEEFLIPSQFGDPD
jgi:hypothetical protein